VFTLNKLQENTKLPDSLRKLARQITTIGFVGSQKQFKKQNKAKAKEQKDKEKEKEKEEGNKSEVHSPPPPLPEYWQA
jgi:ribosomal protein L12E/L44/L45/RPP1/RPP2